jgi:hypothetical protein
VGLTLEPYPMRKKQLRKSFPFQKFAQPRMQLRDFYRLVQEQAVTTTQPIPSRPFTPQPSLLTAQKR